MVCCDDVPGEARRERQFVEYSGAGDKWKQYRIDERLV
jgi:hypothetical protein